jgi:dTDP-4-dehydrorhamnose 3,5-epimerase
MPRKTVAAASTPLEVHRELLAATTLRPLVAHRDTRGMVAEFYRGDWLADRPPVAQWTLTVSEAGVMRGAHVHIRHHDYFVLMEGYCTVGLYDLRPGTPSTGRSVVVELRGEQPAALTIPPGVLHAFYMHTRVVYALGLSAYYDPQDEFGCHWRDPELGIDWPVSEAQLSARDTALPPLRILRASLQRLTA